MTAASVAALLSSDGALRLLELGICALGLMGMITVHYLTIRDLRQEFIALRRVLMSVAVNQHKKE